MEPKPSTPRPRGRPPKRPAGPYDTRELMLRAGLAFLTEKGFASSGLDEILHSVGIPKGSFYHHFASKEAFGLALIERYGDYFARKLDRHFSNTTLAPLTRLQAFIDDAQTGLLRFGFRRGCLIGNLGQEAGSLPPSYAVHLQAVLADWQNRLRGCLEAACASGQIAAHTDCTQQAAYFWIGWEGAVMRARLEHSNAPLQLFAQMFFAGLPRP